MAPHPQTPPRTQQMLQDIPKSIIRALDQRILVMDGAMGTALQSQNLVANDFGGPAFQGCHEYLVCTRPNLISTLHETYLQAGCDILETHTFGANPSVLKKYGLEAQTFEINRTAAQLARKAADRYSTAEKPRFVAGCIGPAAVTNLIQESASQETTSLDALEKIFYLQAKALSEGGVDYFLLETFQDTLHIKAGISAIQLLCSEMNRKIPVAVSVTLEPRGTMLGGQSIEALCASLSHFDLLYLGLNCATGPEFMAAPLRALAQLTKFRVSCVPNAGLPDENGCYLETPALFSHVLSRFVLNGWINVLGGCCGTDASHIETLCQTATRGKPRIPPVIPKSYLSGIDYLEITNASRPIWVSEGTISRNSKNEMTSESARTQIKNGAQIIDVSLASTERDELKDMRSFLKFAHPKIRTPLMIRSTQPEVVELALKSSPGKSILYSVNLKDGFDPLVPLARRHGAALVVKTMDPHSKGGVALTRTRKLEIAEKSYTILTQKYDVPPEDIYWDPLVFSCFQPDSLNRVDTPDGAPSGNPFASARETIEGIRLIKKRFPSTQTLLDIPQVSFGLPAEGRDVLNSVFLNHCIEAGLDLAFFHPEKRVLFITKEEQRLSENLLFQTCGESSNRLAEFTDYFKNRLTQSQQKISQLPLSERLSLAILEGSSSQDSLNEALLRDLNEALRTQKPLEIINGPLMKGMDDVGKLFNANQMMISEVLQSAETMKAAVAYLETFMEKEERSPRGKVLLASVKGDVHEIGKNLVEIILRNNGFQIVNLGIQVPPEKLIEAIREHNPDLVGLSGLLMKSAQQMVTTAKDFADAGVTTPILVGGAALSAHFVDRHIAQAYTTGTVAYARTVMDGLDLAKVMVDPARLKKFKEELDLRRAQLPKNITPPRSENFEERSGVIPVLQNLPEPSDFERHLIRNTPIDQIWNFINPLMLYGRHLGIRGSSVRLLEAAALNSTEGERHPQVYKKMSEEDPKGLKIWEAVQEVKEDYRNTEIMKPAAVYQFFKAASDGNKLLVYPKNNLRNPVCVFDFPRQRKLNGLCLSDYSHPLRPPQNPKDTVALFLVSVGKGVRQMAELLKNRGDYLKSHIVQALALESAEAYAEMIHSQIRKSWGFPDSPNMTLMEKFQSKYRGKRYSFGYPACPKLDDQTLLWKLLDPSPLGVELTDGFMMDPEASVSALVFHHPHASYFSVGHQSGEAGHEDNR